MLNEQQLGYLLGSNAPIRGGGGLSKLVKDNLGRMYCIAHWQFWNSADAMDVVQDALTESITECSNGTTTTRKHCLYKVLNRVVSRTKKRCARRSPHVPIHDLFARGVYPIALQTAPEMVPTAVANQYFHSDFSDAFAALSQRQRDVFWQVAIKEYTESDVARNLGISRGSVHQHYRRAKVALKQKLERRGDHRVNNEDTRTL